MEFSWVIVICHSLANGWAALGSYVPVPGITRYKGATESLWLGLGLELGQFPSHGCVRGRSCHSRTEAPLELGARADSAWVILFFSCYTADGGWTRALALFRLEGQTTKDRQRNMALAAGWAPSGMLLSRMGGASAACIFWGGSGWVG